MEGTGWLQPIVRPDTYATRTPCACANWRPSRGDSTEAHACVRDGVLSRHKTPNASVGSRTFASFTCFTAASYASAWVAPGQLQSWLAMQSTSTTVSVSSSFWLWAFTFRERTRAALGWAALREKVTGRVRDSDAERTNAMVVMFFKFVGDVSGVLVALCSRSAFGLAFEQRVDLG
eukprot:1181816-Prorocentrum_minimum.AAC.1